MANEMNALTTMLSETTLNNNMAYYGPSAAPIPNDLDDDDLWAPHIRSTQIEDLVVPPEMRILPDPVLRQYLSDLYYEVVNKNFCYQCSVVGDPDSEQS